MRSLVLLSPLLLVLACPVIEAQNPVSASPANNFTANYPANGVGVLVQSASSWQAVASEMPVKTKAARGVAASLSYGMVRAKIVAEYAGEQAVTEVAGGQPVLCICHIVSLPGDPVIVRLHPKKDSRELDGGRMTVYPVVGNSKMADANKSDLIPVDVSRPEAMVWLVRPSVELPPGEYALMLGTQNVAIYPFSVVPAP